jgi:hypothetical protein
VDDEVDAGMTPSGVEFRHAAVDGPAAVLDADTEADPRTVRVLRALFGPHPFDRYELAITDPRERNTAIGVSRARAATSARIRPHPPASARILPRPCGPDQGA